MDEFNLQFLFESPEIGECPICFENVELYPLICHDLHKVCQRCCDKIDEHCPFCRTTIKEISQSSRIIKRLGRFMRDRYVSPV